MRVSESSLISADSNGSFVEESKLTVSREEFFAQKPVRLACKEYQTQIFYLLDGHIYYTESENAYSPVILTGMRPAEIFGSDWRNFYTAVK